MNQVQLLLSVVGRGRVGENLKVLSGPLADVRCLQLECTRVLHEVLLVSVLLYGNETMIWREKERSRIRALQMESLRGLLGIRKWIEF